MHSISYHVSVCLVLLLHCLGNVLGEDDAVGDEAPENRTTPGNLALLVNNATVSRFMPAIIRIVNRNNFAFMLPARVVSGVKFGPMPFVVQGLGNATITMKKQNKLIFSVLNVSLGLGSTKFKKGLVIASCRGRINVSMIISEASIAFNLTTGVNNTLRVNVEDVTVSIGTFNITPVLDNWCMVFDTFIIKGIKNQEQGIIEAIQNLIHRSAAKAIESKINDIFLNIPLVATEAPNITDGELRLFLTLLPDLPGADAQSGSKAKPLDAPLPDRDFGLVMSFDALNSILQLAAETGLATFTVGLRGQQNSSIIDNAYPEAYMLCPDCPLVVSFKFFSPPHVQGSNQSVTVQIARTLVALGMAHPSGGTIPLISLFINTTVCASNVFFNNQCAIPAKLGMDNLSMSVETTNIGSIDGSTLNYVTSRVLNGYVLPELSDTSEKKAVLEGFSRPVLNVTNVTVTFGVDMLFENVSCTNDMLSAD